MIRLLSTTLILCLVTSVARAEVGCAVSCTTPCQESCGGELRCKSGCGLLAHGNWLKRKSCCDVGCTTGCSTGCDAWAEYDPCGCDSGRCGHKHGGGCGWFGHRRCLEGQDWYFNCGCNGSYNYPVPPLYTYHWPGMYKAQRMTDYQSPWRFPPLRPYTEEKLAPLIEEAPQAGDGALAPIVHIRQLPAGYSAEGVLSSPGEVESVSSRLMRMGSR